MVFSKGVNTRAGSEGAQLTALRDATDPSCVVVRSESRFNSPGCPWRPGRSPFEKNCAATFDHMLRSLAARTDANLITAATF